MTLQEEPQLTPQQLEDAARQAQEASFQAEKAAAVASDNAELAQAAASEAKSISEQLLGISEALTGPSDFLFLAAIFVLAIFVGYYVVWSVTPALHTPLMSVTNAVSSVIIVGALIAVGASFADSDTAWWAKGFGFVAIFLASVNIFGGFLVTQRMLAMYKKKEN